MTYKHVKQIDKQADIILPCRIDELNVLSEFSKIDSLDFTGEFATLQTLYSTGGSRIYLVGIGEAKDTPKLSEAFKKLCFEQKKYWKKSIQVVANHLSEEEVKKAAIGMEMATYEIAQFKSDKDKQDDIAVAFYSESNITDAIEEGFQTGATINRIKALVDAPPNVKTPEYLGKWAETSSKEHNYKCTVFHHKELEKKNFDAVIAVGQGSVNPPVVIVTEYKGRKDATIDIGLVGKGITFDSGGLSIKPSQNLHYMKSDMGGAAVVLGVVELAAKLKLPVNIVGVVGSAENAVDMHSYRPGDVINSYSGKTIEIIDTDAEGRLVLADGLSYMIKNHNPKQVIDLATLTGSVVRALGYSAAGMFTNDQEMAASMSKIGSSVHERVWQLPLYEDFENDLHSDIADLRNFSGKPIAGAITAAKFLEAFTEKHEHWMHLDIAGVSFGDSPYAKMKSASGYGVQLILNYIKSL